MSGVDVLMYCKYLGDLKHLKRTGWVIRDVVEPESVASHMYRMGCLTFLLDDTDGVNIHRCLKLALVHDMAEAIVGDITPHCGVPVEEKHKQESEAMEKIASYVPAHTREELVSLYHEYEDQVTPESHIVKDLDRFDMIVQAFEYEKKFSKPGFLQEFFDAVKNGFKHPKVKKWVEDLKAKREEWQQSHTDSS